MKIEAVPGRFDLQLLQSCNFRGDMATRLRCRFSTEVFWLATGVAYFQSYDLANHCWFLRELIDVLDTAPILSFGKLVCFMRVVSRFFKQRRSTITTTYCHLVLVVLSSFGFVPTKSGLLVELFDR